MIRHVDSGALTVLAQDDVGGLQVREILHNPYFSSNPKCTTKRRLLDELDTYRLWPTPFKIQCQGNTMEIVSSWRPLLCVFSFPLKSQGTASQNVFIFAAFLLCLLGDLGSHNNLERRMSYEKVLHRYSNYVERDLPKEQQMRASIFDAVCLAKLK